MLEKWYRCIELSISGEEFHQLPRHAAYKYEYFDGKAWLTPRPRGAHALLDLAAVPEENSDEPQSIFPEKFRIDAPEDKHWERLPRLLANAFHRVPPFCSLDDDTRVEAAADWLRHTRESGDGPLISKASFVAVQPDRDQPIGAILVTLLPDRDLTDWDGMKWPEPPPADCIERRLGRPHLTWVFVSSLYSGRGIGTALLRAASDALKAIGYPELASSFLVGNERSMSWHWRNGFRLLPHPGSLRRIHL